MDATKLSKHIAGLSVSRVTQADPAAVAIHFTNGSVLVVGRDRDGVAATLREPGGDPRQPASKDRPTRRQREYLDFISRYILRFGCAPAESDIERHFLVSAPSVNQMVRTLERRGFITRVRGFNGQVMPRSIRVLVDRL